MIRSRKHIVKRILKRTGLVILATGFLFFLLHLIFPLRDDIEYSTVITDNRGKEIHVFLTSDDKWRLNADADEISPLLKKTILAKEDRYFYRHPGVNPFAVFRALFNNIVSGRRTSGASTITMQLARALEPRPRNIWSKMIEMFRSFQLEIRYSKDEILRMYLNLVPYGGNIEGVKAASLLYFKKDPDHLSLAEITALSIIPNRPSTLVIGKNNEQIKEHRNHWLKRFAEEGVFTDREIEDALAEPLNATRGTMPRYIPHLALKLKNTGEDQVHTYIDLNTQMKIEKLTKDYVRSLKLKNISNAAVIVIENKSGNVISYLGSADFYDSAAAGQVNGAAAIRQPGSTLKPLLYAMCIDEGLLTPKRMMSDVAVNYEGYMPENYDQNFNGYVTLEYALEHSLNIPAVKALRLMDKDRFVDRLASCGFAQIRADRRKLGLSMVLGGCGATLEELTAMYASFANRGIYRVPSYAQEISGGGSSQAVSEAACFMINDMLSKVNRPDFPLNWQATERMPRIAWKTGTSYGKRDGWSIGYNRNYTVGVWTGNFSGIGVPDLSGSQTATPLLFRVFNTLDYDSDEFWFKQPEDCELRKVCSETGMVPAPHCTNIVTDYFIPLISSTSVCDNVKEIMVSPDSAISYCAACAPASGYLKKKYRMVEPEMQEYLQVNSIPYQPVPAHNPDCERIFVEGSPQIRSPQANAEYLVDINDPEPIMLSCKTGADVSRVYWYINDRFFRSATPGENLFFMPEEGPLKISCSDDKGRNSDVRVVVRMVRL